MKRTYIIGTLVGLVGLIVLSLEIWVVMGQVEHMIRRNVVSASILPIAQVHAPPAIQSTRTTEWENIYAYIQKKNHKVYPRFAAEITDHVIDYSDKYNIKWPIVLSVMVVESNFNYSSVSDKDAVGLMQVVHKYWKDDQDYKKIIEKENDLFDPKLNIEAGCLILSKLKAQHKDPRKYLNAYYGGTGYYEKVSVAFSNLMLTTEYQ